MAGIVISVKLLQPEKADPPIEVTPSWSSTFSKLTQFKKVAGLISSTLPGIVTEVKLSNPKKVSPGIEVTPSLMITFFIFSFKLFQSLIISAASPSSKFVKIVSVPVASSNSYTCSACFPS